jgi:hypothetical protein
MILTWTGYVDSAIAGKSIRLVAFQRNDAGQAAAGRRPS